MGGKGSSAQNMLQFPTDAERSLQDQAKFQSSGDLAKALRGFGSGQYDIDTARKMARDQYSRHNGMTRDKNKEKHAIQEKMWRHKMYMDSHPDDEGARAQYAQMQNQIKDIESGSQFDERTFERMLSTDPATARQYATEKLQGDATMQSLFGAGDDAGRGGLYGNLMNEQGDLAGYNKNLRETGFTLDESDREAYGQMKGDLTREVGMQEGNIANALASRGLGGAGSGAAVAAYAGSAGNKAEQLSRMGRQFTESKYNKTLARLSEGQNAINSARSNIFNLANFREGAIGAQQDRYAGRQAQDYNQMLQNAQQQFARNAAQQGQANQQFDQRQATKGPGIGGILGTVIGTGGGALLGGPMGASAGSQIGGAVGGAADGGSNSAKLGSAGIAKNTSFADYMST